MSGLVLKDLLNLKKQAKIYILFIIFYGIFAFVSQNSSMVTVMITLFSAIMPITAIAYDERSHFDKYALSMPINRNDIVLSKYVFGIGFTIIGTIIAIITNMITTSVDKSSILMSIGFGGLAIVFISIMLPIAFKFGTEKARIIMMIIFIAPTIVAILLSKMDIAMPSEEMLQRIINYLPIIGTIIVALFLFLSIMLSLNIYRKKEL